jgi:hypothetical protein
MLSPHFLQRTRKSLRTVGGMKHARIIGKEKANMLWIVRRRPAVFCAFLSRFLEPHRFRKAGCGTEKLSIGLLEKSKQRHPEWRSLLRSRR